jgi:hypothetical protein
MMDRKMIMTVVVSVALAYLLFGRRNGVKLSGMMGGSVGATAGNGNANANANAMAQ